VLSLSATIKGLPFAPNVLPNMKSRHGYADKDKDLLSSITTAGAFRKSLVETDGCLVVWPETLRGS
jgi:hypothetical protein